MTTTAATIPLGAVIVKTQPQIRQDMLRTLSNHLRSLGLPQPNVGPGSDYYGLADGAANEISAGLANGTVNTNNQMPDTAAGSFLDRWLALFGLKRRGATNSAGVVAPAFTITQGYTTILAGSQLLDSVGLRYQVTVGGSYGPGNPSLSQPANLYVPVASIDTGSAVNHANGDQLSWLAGPAYVGPTVSVGTTGGKDGLEGGNDSEATQDEPPRARLFDRLQNPPAGGNWNDVNKWIQDSSPDVQAGFTYPALLGPATVFFCAIQAAQTTPPLSSASKNRSLASALMTGTVIPYVQGRYSARAAVVGTTPINQPVDVSLLISLPSAPTASPSGPGGGWLDGTPWPQSFSNFPAQVSVVTSSTEFTITAHTAPTPGVSRVAYVSPSNWQMYTATVASFSGSAGAYDVVIDTPWPNLSTDVETYPLIAVFPQSVNQANYLAAVLQGFANLGPGEWIASSSPTFVRAFRHPTSALSWPSTLDARFLRTVEDSGTEVESVQYLYLPTSTPTVPTAPVTITSTEPFLLTSNAPSILTPQSISWYQQ